MANFMKDASVLKAALSATFIIFYLFLDEYLTINTFPKPKRGTTPSLTLQDSCGDTMGFCPEKH